MIFMGAVSVPSPPKIRGTTSRDAIAPPAKTRQTAMITNTATSSIKCGFLERGTIIELPFDFTSTS